MILKNGILYGRMDTAGIWFSELKRVVLGTQNVPYTHMTTRKELEALDNWSRSSNIHIIGRLERKSNFSE